jgi:hypothetical protein
VRTKESNQRKFKANPMAPPVLPGQRLPLLNRLNNISIFLQLILPEHLISLALHLTINIQIHVQVVNSHKITQYL